MNYYEKIVRVHCEAIERSDPKDVASFEKPKIYGCFSIDKDRKYVPGMQNLMYFYSPIMEQGKIELNLNSGMESVVRKPENLFERLDHLLNFILHNVDKLLNRRESNKLLDADFVCFRGLLTQIMCSMHLREEWTIYATKWKGTIYLCAADTAKTFNIPKKEQDKFCSWGYKFEQYMLTKKIGVPPDTTQPVIEPEEFCCIFKSKLSSHNILYGAEMDGILSNENIDESNPDWEKIEFIELKTSKKVFNVNNDRSLKMYKFIKWWTQSYLVNIKKLYCGFRDKHGIVRDIVPFNVKDLVQISADTWNWRTCLNFCNVFLNIVKDVIPNNTNDPYAVWKFNWQPNMQHFKIEDVQGKSEYSFLPTWYMDEMKNIPKE